MRVQKWSRGERSSQVQPWHKKNVKRNSESYRDIFYKMNDKRNITFILIAF